MLLRSMKMIPKNVLPRLTTSLFKFKSDIANSDSVKEKWKSNPTYQKAFLANEIIGMIQKPSKDVTDTPLRYQILEFIEDDKNSQEIAKKKLRQIFDGGVKLNINLYPQHRISTAQTLKNKIIFYPTHFITGKIFKTLNSRQPYQVLFGHFGISKTFSTILFKLLNDFIVDYKMQLSNPADICEKIIRGKKIFYWTLRMKEDTMKSVDDMLKSQLLPIELQQLDKRRQNSNQQDKYILKEIYRNKEIQINLVIDQFHQLISEVRTQDYKSDVIDSQKIKNQKEKKLMEILQIIQSKLEEYNKIVYLSSVNIEKLRLQQINLKSKDVEKVETTLLRFNPSQKIYRQRSQLIDYFLYLFEETHQDQIKRLRDQLKINRKQLHQNLQKHLLQNYSNLEKQNDEFYLTHLAIRYLVHQKFKEQTDVSNQISFKDQSSLKIYLTKIFQQVLKISMPQLLSIKVKQFLQNQSDLKETKQLFLYEFLQQYQRNQAAKLPRSTPLKLKKNEIKFLKQQSLIEIEKIMDRHLFKFENDEFQLLISPKLFFNLTIVIKDKQETVDRYILNAIANIKTEALQQNVNDGSAMGKTIQNMIINILAKDNSSLRLLNRNKSELQTFAKIDSVISTFNSISFLNVQGYSFVNSAIIGLKSMVSQLQKQNQQNELNRIFLPIGENQENFQIKQKKNLLNFVLPTSKDIDFIIVKLDKEKGFTINAFDVTADQKVSIIKQKITKFLKSYKKFSNNSKNKVLIDGKSFAFAFNYYVLSIHQKNSQIQTQLSNIQQLSKQEKLNFISQTNAHFLILKKKQMLQKVGYFAINKDFILQAVQKRALIDLKILGNILEAIKAKKSKKSNKKLAQEPKQM